MNHPNYAIARWLSRGDIALEMLLQHCDITPVSEGQQLKIYCPASLFKPLLTYIPEIDWQSSRALISSLELYSVRNGEPTCEMVLMAENLPRSITTDQVDVLGVMLLKELGISFDRSIAIVEMGTNKPVFCSKGVLEQSKAKDANDWMEKQDMSLYHYPEGLKTLETAFERQVAHGVEWTAKTFDFHPIHIVANVYAGTLNSKAVRVVEQLDWKLI